VPYFALTMVNGPSYDASCERRQQDGWDAHADFMDALVDDGFVLLGGPYDDGDDVLVLVQAGSEDEIRARLAEDPWEQMGILHIGRIRPWTIWLGSARIAPG
jgi:uncharacterized protein YciI